MCLIPPTCCINVHVHVHVYIGTAGGLTALSKIPACNMLVSNDSVFMFMYSTCVCICTCTSNVPACTCMYNINYLYIHVLYMDVQIYAPYWLAVTLPPPPFFATYFQAKEGGGHRLGRHGSDSIHTSAPVHVYMNIYCTYMYMYMNVHHVHTVHMYMYTLYAVGGCDIVGVFLQVLGAQKKTLAGFSSAAILPHTGFIYYSDLVQSMPEVRGGGGDEGGQDGEGRGREREGGGSWYNS